MSSKSKYRHLKHKRSAWVVIVIVQVQPGVAIRRVILLRRRQRLKCHCIVQGRNQRLLLFRRDKLLSELALTFERV